MGNKVVVVVVVVVVEVALTLSSNVTFSMICCSLKDLSLDLCVTQRPLPAFSKAGLSRNSAAPALLRGLLLGPSPHSGRARGEVVDDVRAAEKPQKPQAMRELKVAFGDMEEEGGGKGGGLANKDFPAD